MAVLNYGNWSSSENEVSVNLLRSGLEDPTGLLYGYVESWAITGILQADGISAIKTAQEELAAAFSESGKDIDWSFDGTKIHEMKNDDTLYGVRVMSPPHFPKGDAHGELVNRRSYTITVEGTFINETASAGTGEDPYLLNYESQLVYTGTGGTTFGHLPTLVGNFQKQVLTEKSLVKAQISGMKTGLLYYPAADIVPVNWESFEKVDARQIRYGNPRRINGSAIEYPIYWNYTFELNQNFPAPEYE